MYSWVFENMADLLLLVVREQLLRRVGLMLSAQLIPRHGFCQLT